MRIDDIITADHREIGDLFDELEPLAGNDRRSSEAMRIATKLAVSLKTHDLAEAKVVYEAIRTASEQLAACALEGPHEMHALELLLDRLLLLRPGPEFRAALAVARRMFDHHADHEARELLPAMTATLPAGECEQLAKDLVSEKQRLLPQIARHISPLAQPRLSLV